MDPSPPTRTHFGLSLSVLSVCYCVKHYSSRTHTGCVPNSLSVLAKKFKRKEMNAVQGPFYHRIELWKIGVAFVFRSWVVLKERERGEGTGENFMKWNTFPKRVAVWWHCFHSVVCWQSCRKWNKYLALLFLQVSVSKFVDVDRDTQSTQAVTSALQKFMIEVSAPWFGMSFI